MAGHKETHSGNDCESCKKDSGFCDEHKLAIAQLEALVTLPSMVHRMYGIISLIGTLFVLLVGLMFNMHFEYKKSAETYSTKIDSISAQISKIELENNKAMSAVGADILRINIVLEQIVKRNQTRDIKEGK